MILRISPYKQECEKNYESKRNQTENGISAMTDTYRLVFKQRFSLKKMTQSNIQSKTLQNPAKLDQTMAKKQNNLMMAGRDDR
jgi:hypothetical protein